jgi:hypothetical protein
MVGTILMDVSQRIQNAYVLTDSDDNIEGWVTCRGAHTIRLEIMLAKPSPFLQVILKNRSLVICVLWEKIFKAWSDEGVLMQTIYNIF